MNCIVFIASTTGKNIIKMKQLHQQFGTNIPCFLQYEGGTGLNYLCCVDSLVDSESICMKHGYDYHRLVEIKIDESLYTSEYTIHPTYNKQEPKYRLDKNRQYILDDDDD